MKKKPPARFAAFVINPAQGVPAPAPAPSSWWLGLSPAEFSAQLHQELPRMQGSKMAQRQMLITPPAGGRD